MHGLREVTSERQVISHDPSVTQVVLNNVPKLQELLDIYLLYNKTIVDLCFGRHGVLLYSGPNHFDCQYDVYCSITLHVHLNISQ